MARNTKKERARQREIDRQLNTQRNIETRQRNAWQEVIDDAHAEANVINRTWDTEQLHEQIREQRHQIDADRYYAEKEARRQAMGNEMFDQAEARINPTPQEQVEAVARNLEVDETLRSKAILKDAVKGTKTPEEAQSALNKMARGNKITPDELNRAKAFLTDNQSNYYRDPIKVKNASGVMRRNGDVINPTTPLKASARGSNADLNAKYFPNTAKRMNNASIEGVVAEGASDVGNHHLKQALSGRNLNALLNLGFAINDYNSARESGESVAKAGVKAAGLFVAGEMLGPWMFPVMAMKSLPSLAVAGVEATQGVTRKMNSTTRIQTFGEAQFQDTQQLATMRQAGMEMAKMSQYNLQQSIMGNEAQYMHRL